MKVLSNTAECEGKLQFRNRSNCHLDGKCVTSNIIYEAKVTLNQPNYKEKIYIKTAEADFKHIFNNQAKFFNLEQYVKDTELSKEYWTMKCNYFTPKVT